MSGAHIALLALERHTAGLASGADAHAIDAHLESCSECATRLREINAEREAFLLTHPPEARVRQLIEASFVSLAPRRFVWLAPALGLAAVAAIVLLVVVPVTDPKITPKGVGADVTFEVHWPNGRVTPGQDGAELPAGAALQLHLDTRGTKRAAVYAWDHRGATTLLFETATEGDEVALPRTFVLDESPEAERLLIVRSNAPIDSELVEGRARRAFEDAGRDIERAPAILEMEVARLSSILIKKTKKESSPPK